MKIIHSLGFYFLCTVLENKTSKWCMITNYRQFLTFTFSTLMYIFTVTTVTSLCLPNARSWAFPPYLIFSLTLVFFLFNDTSLTHLQDFISFYFLPPTSPEGFKWKKGGIGAGEKETFLDHRAYLIALESKDVPLWLTKIRISSFCKEHLPQNTFLIWTHKKSIQVFIKTVRKKIQVFIKLSTNGMTNITTIAMFWRRMQEH